MRVALVVEPLWHRVPGGTGRYVAELAAALADRDDVEVVGVAARHRDPPALPAGVAVRHLRWPRAALYEGWSRAASARSIERLVPEADLVHATSLAAPHRSRRPLVITVHDLLYDDPRNGLHPRARRLLARALRRVVPGADAVVVPSLATADALAESGVALPRVHVIPEAAALPDVDPDEVAAVRAELGLSRPFLLSVGTVEPRKNLATVLAAAARLRRDHDVDLALVGPDGWGVDLHRMVERSGLPTESLHLLGHVGDRALAALYAAAEVFVWPTLGEGFGLPVLEAQAAGTPVVTSATTATAELVDGGGVLVDPTDVDAVVDAVDGLLHRPGQRAAMGEAARRTAAGYSWARTAELTAQVYAAVLA